MAAIIRVKRRLDEDPAENLIIQYKRSRTDGSKTDEPTKLCLSLVTTVKSKDEALSRPLQKTLRRQQLQASYKSYDSKRLAQARAENTAARKANRYRIVNSRRTVGGDVNDVGGEAPSQMVEQSTTESVAQAVGGLDCVSSSDSDVRTSSESSPASAGACSSDAEDPVIHDVEVDGDSAEDRLQEAASSGCGIMLNGQPLVSTPTSLGAESSYVYDLYYASTGAQPYSFRDIENILSIEAFHDSLVSEADRVQEYEEVYEDEDDSNDEDNWRNDYPDEEFSHDGDSDDEVYGDFLEGEAPHLYRRTVEDDFLSEAMGTRLHIYGSDASSSNEDESDDEDAYEEDDSCHRASSYSSYKRGLKEDLDAEDINSEDSD